MSFPVSLSLDIEPIDCNNEFFLPFKECGDPDNQLFDDNDKTSNPSTKSNDDNGEMSSDAAAGFNWTPLK